MVRVLFYISVLTIYTLMLLKFHDEENCSKAKQMYTLSETDKLRFGLSTQYIDFFREGTYLTIKK